MGVKSAQLGTLSYWVAVAAAIGFFMSSARCAAIFFGLLQGDRSDAALTASFCSILGFAILMCGYALHELLTDR